MEQNYKLTIAYDGTRFFGWERQPGKDTIQGKLESVLTAAGCAKESVVMCRIYLTSMDLWDRANAVYSEFFGQHRPARIVLPVGPLSKGCLVELEAVAELAEG